MTLHRTPRWLPFLAALAMFYAIYPLLASTAGGITRVFAEHWPIAVVMTLGSYFAGATPVGGGSVAFPILVMLFDQPPALGREFSFAIQSLGMSVASLYLFAMRRPIDGAFLRPALMGTIIGTPLGCIALSPNVPAGAVKMVFACLWCAFGLFALLRRKRFAGAHRQPLEQGGADVPAFAVGVLAGIVASLIGGGADMIAFSFLVLRRRLDPRIAIPTAMMLMAATSLLALGVTLGTRGLQPGVWGNWLAAAPIVVVGAPLGAFAVGIVPRGVTMMIVSVLCVAQFVWACFDRSLSPAVIGVACIAVATIVLALRGLEPKAQASSSTSMATP